MRCTIPEISALTPEYAWGAWVVSLMGVDSGSQLQFQDTLYIVRGRIKRP